MDDLDRVLEEVERLDCEATPGPWDADHSWWPGEDEDEYAAVGPVHKLRKYDFLDLDTPEKRAGLDVAMMGIRADESLIAHYRTAAPLLAAEVRRLRAEVEQRIAHGNALYDAIVRRLVPHFPAGSRDLDWDVLPGTLAALAREREEARLTLASEQGRQEGAPSDRWYSEVQSGRVRWHRGDPDEAPEVSVFGLADGWRWTEPGHESRPYPTARAAMLAADAAVG